MLDMDRRIPPTTDVSWLEITEKRSKTLKSRSKIAQNRRVPQKTRFSRLTDRILNAVGLSDENFIHFC